MVLLINPTGEAHPRRGLQAKWLMACPDADADCTYGSSHEHQPAVHGNGFGNMCKVGHGHKRYGQTLTRACGAGTKWKGVYGHRHIVPRSHVGHGHRLGHRHKRYGACGGVRCRLGHCHLPDLGWQQAERAAGGFLYPDSFVNLFGLAVGRRAAGGLFCPDLLSRLRSCLVVDANIHVNDAWSNVHRK